MKIQLSALALCALLCACSRDAVEAPQKGTPTPVPPHVTALEESIEDSLAQGHYMKAVDLAISKSRSGQEFESHFRYISNDLAGAMASGDRDAMAAYNKLNAAWSGRRGSR